MKSLLYSLLSLILLSSCKQESYPTNTESQPLMETFNYLPVSSKGTVVVHKAYTLSYREDHEQAEWVAYHLSYTPNHSNFDRPYFISDPLVKTQSADWKNYKNSGYDKGHLCPAGDRKQSYEWYKETFYTSNISPQKHNFNDGVWNRLEQKVRYWAGKYNGLYVVTGGVLTPKLKSIGSESVSVPQYFYKVLLTPDKKRMIAFLVPHEDSEAPLYEFVTSVDTLESLTGIDFFPALPDSSEKILEQNKSYKNWSF